jgi:hypothetical protein
MPSSPSEHFKPEHAIEQCGLALCVISEQGELRPRDLPTVVNQEKGGYMVFVSFAALLEEVGLRRTMLTSVLILPQEFRIFVLNNGPFDASADVSLNGDSLGKWLIAHVPKAWHNICCDSLFKFQGSYGTRLTTCW